MPTQHAPDVSSRVSSRAAPRVSPNGLALGAIALWASLAALGVSLAHVPPFLLTGLALLCGALPALPQWRAWRVKPRVLALGVYGLFGFHFLLFMALRLAPPVEANLVNYLWPLLIVVLSPALIPGLRLRAAHVLAALAGLAGAALAILGGRAATTADLPLAWAGYAMAGGSALIWSTYSLLTRRLESTGDAFPTAAIGLFCVVSGLASLVCHALFETTPNLSLRDLALIGLLGLGPLGAAFYLWDAALKRGDPRVLGVLGYITPVASTLVLMVLTQRPLTWQIVAAIALILGAAAIAMRARPSA